MTTNSKPFTVLRRNEIAHSIIERLIIQGLMLSNMPKKEMQSFIQDCVACHDVVLGFWGLNVDGTIADDGMYIGVIKGTEAIRRGDFKRINRLAVQVFYLGCNSKTGIEVAGWAFADRNDFRRGWNFFHVQRLVAPAAHGVAGSELHQRAVFAAQYLARRNR